MYTAYDAVSYLLDSTGGGAQDGYHRAIRSAVFNAYRDLITAKADWRWYETHEDIDINTRYIAHTLPWGVQSVDSITVNEPVGWDMMARYVTPRDFQRIYDEQWNELIDLIWTVAPSAKVPDRYDLRILTGYGFLGGGTLQGKDIPCPLPNDSKPPDEPCDSESFYASTATLTYRRRPRDLRLTGWEPTSRQGTVAWNTQQSALVTGTNTAFNDHMVGAVLRVSGDPTYEPESLTGLHPYVDEGLITSVDKTGQKLSVWTPAGVIDYTGTKYHVTDYLDISPGMYTAMLSGAEFWLARLMGKDYGTVYELYQRDLRIAFESDAVAVLEGRHLLRRYGYYYPFWYLRPGVDQGVLGPGTGGPNADGTCALKPDVSGGDSDSGEEGTPGEDEFVGTLDGGNSESDFDDCGNP